MKPVVAIEAEATAMHVHVPVAKLAEVQVQLKFCGAAKVLDQNKFAALAEDDSEGDNGASTDVAAAKRLQAEVLRSDLQSIDQALSELSSSGSQAVLAMRAWAVEHLKILEAEGF